MCVERDIGLIIACRPIVQGGWMLEFLGSSCLHAVFFPYTKPILVHSNRPSLKANVKKANVFYFRSTLPSEMGSFFKIKAWTERFFRKSLLYGVISIRIF